MLLQFLSFVQLHCHGMEPALAASEALKQWMERRDRGETVRRNNFGSLLPRGRLTLLTYPRIWPDFERREARHERRMGAERRVVDALREE